MNRLALVVLLLVPLSVRAVDPRELKTGLIAKEGADVCRLDPTIAYHAPVGRPVTWTGYIQIVTPGKYVFSVKVQGGTFRLRLIPPDAAAVDAGSGKELTLAPGVHAVAASFTPTGPVEARVELRWQGPDFKNEPIPYFFFGHLPKGRPKELADHQKLAFGKFLFEENGCKNCHTAPAGFHLVERTGPDLSEIGKRVYPGWIDAWLADPGKLRKHTTMPKMFTDDAKGKAERYAVVQYLASLGGPLTDNLKLPNVKEDVASSNRGKALFTTAGCAACHANTPNAPTRKPREDDDPPPPFDAVGSIYGLGSSTGPQGTYDLGALCSKTQPPILAQYLRDPLKTNPHGRMPAMGLNNNEALDLARFLCRTIDEKIERKMPAAPDNDKGRDRAGWITLGRQLFTSKGCVNCHALTEREKTPLPRFNFIKDTMAVAKSPTIGCLADRPDVDKVPAFPLTDESRSALRAFVRSDLRPNDPKTVAPDPRTAMKRFLCLNCHAKDGEGGIAADLSDQMKQLEKADNADSVQPPRLTGIGHKARTAWLDDVLLKGGRARPWMGLRMPQYGKDNVGFLPVALAHAEGTLPDTGEAVAKPATALLTDGRTLVGKDGHGCIACHDISGVVGGGTRGTDLANVTNRLRRDWFDRWMDNPQRLAPGTQMPQYFLGGKAQIPLLGADPVKHSAAMWDYLALGPGLPLPTGLEPPKGVVIAVKDRPEILRTFMPDGAGTRAVAVGYPGGLNVAFDATQARLAYAWAGNFLDASPVWANRGGAPAKLLGPKIWTGPAGHPWAVTDSQTPPDFAKQAGDPAYGASLPEGKAFHGQPKLVVEGYTLDASGNPTFTYRHGTALRVEETPAIARSPVAMGVERKMTVAVSAGKSAWLNVADADKDVRVAGGKVESELPATARLVLPQPGGKAVVLDAVAPAGSAWVFVPKPAGGSSILLRVPEGKSAVTVTHWAVPKDDDDLIRGLPAGGGR